MAENELGRDALEVFNGKKLSYTYENGWAFTNVFDGSTRITEVEGRGTLRERVAIRYVAPQTYFITWTDDEMGPITQVIDLQARTLIAAVPVDGNIEVWTSTVTAFEDAGA
ncbi:MAG: hypothetical protein ACRBN8_32425 [Nannocystales bacterium]